MQNNGYYTIQGHSRSLILVQNPISDYHEFTSYLCLLYTSPSPRD